MAVRCRRAATLPNVMVATASAATTGAHASLYAAKPCVTTTTRPTSPAAFDTADRYAATNTGAPEYVSGTQTWNRTAPILNASPTKVRPAPAAARPGRVPGSPSATARPPTCSGPVTP